MLCFLHLTAVFVTIERRSKRHTCRTCSMALVVLTGVVYCIPHGLCPVTVDLQELQNLGVLKLNQNNDVVQDFKCMHVSSAFNTYCLGCT